MLALLSHSGSLNSSAMSINVLYCPKIKNESTKYHFCISSSGACEGICDRIAVFNWPSDALTEDISFLKMQPILSPVDTPKVGPKIVTWQKLRHDGGKKIMLKCSSLKASYWSILLTISHNYFWLKLTFSVLDIFFGTPCTHNRETMNR